MRLHLAEFIIVDQLAEDLAKPEDLPVQHGEVIQDRRLRLFRHCQADLHHRESDGLVHLDVARWLAIRQGGFVMLLRTADPFRELDRLTQQLVAGTTNRPAVMPMDAWREGDAFVLGFDLPGIAKDTLDLDVERNVLTVRADHTARMSSPSQDRPRDQTRATSAAA